MSLSLAMFFSCSTSTAKKEKKLRAFEAHKKIDDSAQKLLLEQFRASTAQYRRQKLQRHFISDSFTLKVDAPFDFHVKNADHTEITEIYVPKNDNGDIDTVTPGLNLKAHERQFAQKVVFKFYSRDLAQPYKDKEEGIEDFFFANATWYLIDTNGVFYRYSSFLTTGNNGLEFTDALPADSTDVIKKAHTVKNYTTIEGYVIFKIKKECAPFKVVYALGRAVHLANEIEETDDWGEVKKDRIRGFSVKLRQWPSTK